MAEQSLNLIGEWSWCFGRGRNAHGGSINEGAIIRQPRPGHAIAVAVAPKYATDEQWAEVAPLLAASANLRSAARDLLDELDDGTCIVRLETVESLRAAVAKADGRNPERT